MLPGGGEPTHAAFARGMVTGRAQPRGASGVSRSQTGSARKGTSLSPGDSKQSPSHCAPSFAAA